MVNVELPAYVKGYATGNLLIVLNSIGAINLNCFSVIFKISKRIVLRGKVFLWFPLLANMAHDKGSEFKLN